MSALPSLGLRPGSFLSLFGIVLATACAARAQHSATIDLPDSIAAAGTPVDRIKKIPFYCEGPAVDLSDGTLYFTEQHDNSVSDWPIWKINPANPSDTGSRWVVQSNQSNGLFVDGQGRVIAAQKGKIVRYKKDASLDSVLAVSGSNVAFGQANDFSMGRNGDIFFSDLGSQIYYLGTDRKVKAAMTGLNSVNGVEWVEEDNGLYVNASGHVIRFDVGANGALSNKKDFFTGMSGADGIETDSHGNWYVGSYSEGVVYVCNAKGQSLGKITFKMEAGPYDARSGNQGNVCNVHFGGPENKTLYCTGDGGAYSVVLKIPGHKSVAATPTALAARRILFAKPAEAQTYRADGRFWLDGVPGAEPGRSRAPRLPLFAKP